LLRGGGGMPWQRSPTPAVATADPVPMEERIDAPPAATSAALPPPLPGASGPAAPPLPSAPADGPVGLLVPVQGVQPDDLHDTFGDARGSERSHEALDIMAPAGTPVLAVADGHVEKLVDSERGGRTLDQF